MKLEALKNEKTDVIFVETESALFYLVKKLETVTLFAFDTEFDRFRRTYGFNLLLLQIYDGEDCFLIDPLKIKNLTPLWHVFQNPAICKVAYSCGEDIQLLKHNGCYPKNIFDVQIASKLCDRSEHSLSKILKAEYDLELDKSKQNSDWSVRPIDQKQISYASNDVLHLLNLHSKFLAEAPQRGVEEMLAEENRLCEDIAEPDLSPRLPGEFSKYSEDKQHIVFELIKLRDNEAKKLNLPPFQIFSTSILHDILADRGTFLYSPFKKGFNRHIHSNEKFKQDFINTVKQLGKKRVFQIQEPSYRLSPKEIKELKLAKQEKKEAMSIIYNSILNELATQYGLNAATFILNGFHKALQTLPFAEINLKNYQHKVINAAKLKLNIEL